MSEVIGLGVVSLGIQLSCQMLVLWPLPILRIKPCLSISRPSRIALHIWDGRVPSSASRIEPCEKYEALRILALSVAGS